MDGAHGMNQGEFEPQVLRSLEALDTLLVPLLRELFAHVYPAEVRVLHFEFFPDGFTSHFPVRALAAAAYYEDPIHGAPCADELVLAFSDSAIRRIIDVRRAERSEWRS